MGHNRKIKDITGQRFGRLTVLGHADQDQFGTATWLVRCDCGTVFATRGTHLRRGLTRSCGCLRSELAASRAGRAKKAWMIPVAVIKDGKRTECESICTAAKLIGSAHTTVRTHLLKHTPYKGYTFEFITK